LLDVEGWAELRREHFVRGVSIRELARRTGMSRNTIRAALRSSTAPKYDRALAGSKLDPFKDEIHRLLKADSRLTGQRIRELIAPLGFDGGKTIVDDYLRQVRPLFDPPRTFSARSTGRARSASSTCGSPRPRSRSATARAAGAGS
jgi:transcriptional regulator with XRE-family HTH domain